MTQSASQQENKEELCSASSHGFTIYIISYPLAVAYFLHYFFSFEEFSSSSFQLPETKLAPLTILICLVFAALLVVAGMNILLVSDFGNINSIEDEWSMKEESEGKHSRGVNMIHDLDVYEINELVYQNRHKF